MEFKELKNENRSSTWLFSSDPSKPCNSGCVLKLEHDCKVRDQSLPISGQRMLVWLLTQANKVLTTQI